MMGIESLVKVGTQFGGTPKFLGVGNGVGAGFLAVECRAFSPHMGVRLPRALPWAVAWRAVGPHVGGEITQGVALGRHMAGRWPSVGGGFAVGVAVVGCGVRGDLDRLAILERVEEEFAAGMIHDG
jgi:hypothetical protein